MAVVASGNFYQDFDLTWGDRRAKIFNGGQLLSVSRQGFWVWISVQEGVPVRED
jgi:hypothetical protein